MRVWITVTAARLAGTPARAVIIPPRFVRNPWAPAMEVWARVTASMAASVPPFWWPRAVAAASRAPGSLATPLMA